LPKVSTASDNPFKYDAENGDVNTGIVMFNVWDRQTDEPFELSDFTDEYVIPHMRRNSEQMAEGSLSVPIKRVHNRVMLGDCIPVHKTAG
jgi:hypothetical protein